MPVSVGLRLVAFLIAALLLVWLAGCATKPAAPPAMPAVPTLADEHRRLSGLFEGTTVVIEMTGDGRLRLEVPLKHSFDAGRSAVKPPLAALLDRVANGVKRQRATELRIAAPPDPGGGAALAAERAASTRDYLVSRGVAVTRIASAQRGELDGVEIVVSERR